MVARQVIISPPSLTYTHPPNHPPSPLLAHTYISPPHAHVEPIDNVSHGEILFPYSRMVCQARRLPRSSPAAQALYSDLFMKRSFYISPPPAACSLTPPCPRSCSLHHSVLWLQIYSDSSTLQCTLAAFTVATGVCLRVCESVSVSECVCLGV